MWAFNIQAVLEEDDLWGFIDGSEVKPAATSADDLAKFTKRQKKCKRVLIFSMEEEVQRLIMRLEDPKVIWDKLQQVYRPKTRLRKIQTQREFALVSAKPDEDLQSYANRVRDLAHEVEKAGCAAPTDELITLTMLAGLPPEYNYVVALTDTYPDAEFTSHKVENLIVGEYRRKKLQDTSYVSPEAAEMSGQVLAVKKTQVAGVQKSKPKMKIKAEATETRKCFNCNQRGHLAISCPEPKKSRYKSTTDVDKKIAVVMNGPVVLSCVKARKKRQTSTSIPWIIDCAASMSISPVKSDFDNLRKTSKHSAMLADSSKLSIKGVGNISLISGATPIFLNDVYYMPKLHSRVISAGALSRLGVKFVIEDSICTASKDDKELFRAQRLENNLFEVSDLQKCKPIDVSIQDQHVAAMSTTEVTNLWHERLGHPSYDSQKLMRDKGLVRGLENTVFSKPEVLCEACIDGKATRLPFAKKAMFRATTQLQLVFSDVCGPLPVTSKEGARYFAMFTDDFLRKTLVYLLRMKDKVFDAFKLWKPLVENEVEHKIKVLRTDNGGEYVNHAFESFLAVHGIKHQKTNVYTPQDNGVAERMNRTLLNITRTLLKKAQFSKNIWGEAVLTAAYLRNAWPTKSCEGAVPCEVWSGRKPSVRHFRTYGCRAYATIPKQKRDKLDSRAKSGFLVGYADKCKGYRIWLPAENRVIVSRDVRFQENKFYEPAQHYDYEDFYFHTPESVGEKVGTRDYEDF